METIQIQQIENKPLASLSDRLAASLIDAFIAMVIVLVPFFIIFGFEGFTKLQLHYGFSFTVVMSIIGQCIYLLLHGRLLYKYGQTIGKRYMGIKITDLENNLPPFTTSYVYRFLFISLIALLPVVGSIFYFIDVLFIFRGNRRCIHDLIAVTKVIEA